MIVNHIALWVKDLNGMRDFYVQHFHGTAGELYFNSVKEFRSYFITFKEGVRLELMTQPDIRFSADRETKEFMGYCHMAFSLGSEEAVDCMTDKLNQAGFTIIDGPRLTGDGYYESVFLDPENNRIELTV